MLDGRAGALSLGSAGYSVGQSRDGLVHSTDEYDTLEEAMARFHELTADS